MSSYGFLSNIPSNILQHQQAAITVMGNMQQSTQGPGQTDQRDRVFMGSITKLHDNFGFVDGDVFFQTSVVKGPVPRINDRALVEATYNPNLPYKWNATRVQVLSNNQSPGSLVGH